MSVYKSFNLKERKPKVLMLGNGLLYGQPGTLSWSDFITACSRGDMDSKEIASNDQIPYTIRASIVSDSVDDKKRREVYDKKLNNSITSHNDKIQKLIDIGFDAVLTTNYTYEIEHELDEKFTNYSSAYKSKKYALSEEKKKDSNGSMLKTFNRFALDDRNIDVWHVHGEARSKSSIVLTHTEYGLLVQRMLNYFRENKNRYETTYEYLEFQTWMDYFILGDVYILGLGLDFSEFDLWWLLNRRLREKVPVGEMVFFEPEKSECKSKIEALSYLGVKCKSMGVSVDSDSGNYELFYQRVIEELSSLNDRR